MSFWSPIVRPARAIENAVIRRIARRVEEIRPTRAPAVTTQPDPLYPISDVSGQWREVTRQFDYIEMLQDVQEMYDNDGDVASAFRILGLSAAQKDNEGIAFKLSGRKKLENATVVKKRPDGSQRCMATPQQQAVNEVYDRIETTLFNAGLHRVLANHFERTALYGRHALEIVWDMKGEGTIERFEPVPSIRDGYILRKLHRSGDNAFVGWGLFDIQTSERVREFLPYQLLVFDWNMGLPMAMPVRVQWRQLYQGEEGLFVFRDKRSGSRLAFVNKAWTVSQALEFMQLYDQMKRKGEVGPDSDVAATTDVKLLDPANHALMKIDDLKYRRATIHSALGVPYALLPGYGADVNRDTLREQVKQFIRLLGEFHSVASEPISKVVKTQLWLWGYNPADYPFRTMWTENDEREFLDIVRANSLLSGHGLSDTTILQEAGYDPEDERENREYEDSFDGGDRLGEEIQALRDARAKAGETQRANPEGRLNGTPP